MKGGVGGRGGGGGETNRGDGWREREGEREREYVMGAERMRLVGGGGGGGRSGCIRVKNSTPVRTHSCKKYMNE